MDDEPLPFADPERVVIVGEDLQGQTVSVSGGNFNDWRSRSRSFTELAAFHLSSFNLTSGDAPERVLGARTTHNFFAVFGIPAALGRTFGADEDRPGGDVVVVLSDRLWRQHFAASPGVIGTRIRLDVLGTADALAASQVLTAYVFGITTRDPLTMVVVIALLVAAALAATAIPARRAAKVEPARALSSS